jgi:hypothetical protein
MIGSSEQNQKKSVAPAQAGAQVGAAFLDSRPPTESFEGRLRGNDLLRVEAAA